MDSGLLASDSGFVSLLSAVVLPWMKMLPIHTGLLRFEQPSSLCLFPFFLDAPIPSLALELCTGAPAHFAEPRKLRKTPQKLRRILEFIYLKLCGRVIKIVYSQVLILSSLMIRKLRF